MPSEAVRGRLVLDDRVAVGQVSVEDGVITGVELGAATASDGDALPYLTPGFVDVHVHGWGGFDAMGGAAALDGMSRALLRRGVTSFLPTAVTAPIEALAEFATTVREWAPGSPEDGADALGTNLEGPFLAEARHGAHDPGLLRHPADVDTAALEPLLDGLRLMTVAAELRGARELIERVVGEGAAVSVGHSDAPLEVARAAYAAGATSTTHLFNAMSGVDHRSPGVALAALLDDDVYVELIADGIHVHPALWALITRTKPADKLMLVSDALAIAGMGGGRGKVGELEVEVRGDRATLAGTSTLAGSVIALDTAVRNLVSAGVSLPDAIAAASRNPLALLGVTDRGRIAAGQRADLVELDGELRVRRVMKIGTWIAT
jgi:N-acetylglucosamine-6-phosphate deacetylase